MLGSHIDTVVAGGRFDGTAGVVIALEVAQALAENGVKLTHDLEVVDFLSEEPSDYGVSCVGSRALVGALDEAMLALRNDEGECLAAAIERAGGLPSRLSKGPLRKPGELSAFLELHIEQGTVLETTPARIGVVTGIVGIRRYEIVVSGQADHAGTTPMNRRVDALVAASELVLKVNDLASELAGRNGLVATIGKVNVRPNVANVVPGEVTVVLEVRCTASEDIDSFMSELEGQTNSKSGKPTGSFKLLSRTTPVPCDTGIRAALWDAADRLGLGALDLPSGAGHDAALLGAVCPIGMIFVPSFNGRSHVPEEYTSIEDLHDGARVMLETVLALDTGPGANAVME